ncbi:MAG TPA: hypothetical protein PKG69_03715 [Methanoregulaceae archaeon]|nr:hypothetical protein [Methanoregulaceae archaeon]
MKIQEVFSSLIAGERPRSIIRGGTANGSVIGEGRGRDANDRP